MTSWFANIHATPGWGIAASGWRWVCMLCAWVGCPLLVLLVGLLSAYYVLWLPGQACIHISIV